MALPDGTLSSRPVPAPMLGPRNRRSLYTWDWEIGGIALQDVSRGLLFQEWRAYLQGGWLWLAAEIVPSFQYMEAPGVTEISLCFDQNMNGTIAFVQGGQSKLYWYDTVAQSMQTMDLPGAISPRVALDDKRPQSAPISDIILAYTKADNRLYYRIQRDRFTIEYELGYAPRPLHKIGMGTNLRMQFHFRSGC